MIRKMKIIRCQRPRRDAFFTHVPPLGCSVYENASMCSPKTLHQSVKRSIERTNDYSVQLITQEWGERCARRPQVSSIDRAVAPLRILRNQVAVAPSCKSSDVEGNVRVSGVTRHHWVG